MNLPFFSKWMVQPGWEEVLHRHQLHSLNLLYACKTGTVLTQSGTSEVRRVELTDATGSHVLFIKKYWFNSAYKRFKGTLRGTFFGTSKVQREHHNLLRLKAWGLDAPQPIAWGEDKRFGWLHRSVLVSEGVPNPVGLDSWFVSILPSQSKPTQRAHTRQLLQSLAPYIARMHKHHFTHQDLFWRNIILSGTSLQQFHLIDSHKGHVWSPRTHHQPQAEDLAALDAVAPLFLSKTQRLRFILDYVSQGRVTPQVRTLIRRILKLADPLRERQRRRLPKPCTDMAPPTP